jgi:ABC-type branched-subunit amino acid transport system permease subunit
MSYLIITVATFALIYAVAAAALNVRWGWAGEFDFLVYALLAVGAYTYAVMVLPPAPRNDTGLTYILGLRQSPVVGALAAVAVCSVLSLVIGAIALRSLRQVYFGITTFASVLILSAVITQQTALFNGFTGVFGGQQPFNSALNLSPSAYHIFFLGLCAVVLLGVYLLLQRIFWSPFGIALRAIREDEVAAAAFGHDPYIARLKAYILGGALAGLSGALLMAYIGAFNPQAWSPIETVLLFAAIIIGGTGNMNGAILGSLIVFGVILEGTQFLPSLPAFPNAEPALRALAIGLVMLVFLRWRPQGILPEQHYLDNPRVRADPLSKLVRQVTSKGAAR